MDSTAKRDRLISWLLSTKSLYRERKALVDEKNVLVVCGKWFERGFSVGDILAPWGLRHIQFLSAADLVRGVSEYPDPPPPAAAGEPWYGHAGDALKRHVHAIAFKATIAESKQICVAANAMSSKPITVRVITPKQDPAKAAKQVGADLAVVVPDGLKDVHDFGFVGEAIRRQLTPLPYAFREDPFESLAVKEDDSERARAFVEGSLEERAEAIDRASVRRDVSDVGALLFALQRTASEDLCVRIFGALMWHEDDRITQAIELALRYHASDTVAATIAGYLWRQDRFLETAFDRVQQAFFEAPYGWYYRRLLAAVGESLPMSADEVEEGIEEIDLADLWAANEAASR